MSQCGVAADESGLTRRQALRAGAGMVLLGSAIQACGDGRPRKAADITLRARRAEIGLGDRGVATWTYDGRLPGREVRLKQGRPVRIRLINELDQPTSIHWHGIRLRNEADGVPGFTQKAVRPGGEHLYEFTPPDAGTYFLHSHVGMQLDRGLYAPLIVEAAAETLEYDSEAVLVFDDWLDGLAGTPDERLARLRGNGMDMGGMEMGSDMPDQRRRTPVIERYTDRQGGTPDAGSLGWLANQLAAKRLDVGDVRDYPLYLVNGRPPTDPARVNARRGERIRLRLINASADTHFCVFVEGHALSVVAADGAPVQPVSTDAVLMGMGERYDAIVEVSDTGAGRIVGVPLGKAGRAEAVLRDGRAPRVRNGGKVVAPRRVIDYSDLVPLDEPSSEGRSPRLIRLDLAQGEGNYSWTIGGQAFESADPIRVARDEHVRFVMYNRTAMPHPMHLHGHSFRIDGRGPLKDTAIAMPRRELALDWIGDNPGEWAYHCHNAYHQAAGMMRRVEVA